MMTLAELARDYVIVQSPLTAEVLPQTPEDFAAGVVRFRSTTTWRLRPKTPKEHAAAGVGPDGQYPPHDDAEPVGGPGGTDA